MPNRKSFEGDLLTIKRALPFLCGAVTSLQIFIHDWAVASPQSFTKETSRHFKQVFPLDEGLIVLYLKIARRSRLLHHILLAGSYLYKYDIVSHSLIHNSVFEHKKYALSPKSRAKNL